MRRISLVSGESGRPSYLAQMAAVVPDVSGVGRLTWHRHHVFAKTSHKDLQLAEVGPRFEAKR